jgi:hypothetical protein
MNDEKNDTAGHEIKITDGMMVVNNLVFFTVLTLLKTIKNKQPKHKTNNANRRKKGTLCK